MKVFEIYNASTELKFNEVKKLRAGVTQEQADIYADKISVHETLEEAREMLKAYSTTIQKFPSNRVISVNEYYIEENEYDEDGDWISGGDIWEFTQPEIKLVNNDTDEVMGTFNNYEDALKALKAYEGDDEIEIDY